MSCSWIFGGTRRKSPSAFSGIEQANVRLEDQAFDRAHRLGQTRAVNIWKLTVEETVEDRILAVSCGDRIQTNKPAAEPETRACQGRSQRRGREEPQAYHGGHHE